MGEVNLNLLRARRRGELLLNMVMYIIGPRMSSPPLMCDSAIDLIRDLMRAMGVLREPELGIQANIVIRKLAHLRIVDTEHLRLLRGAEPEPGDEVHDPEDDSGHDEGVPQSGGGVGHLEPELLVVVVEPPARDGCPVERGNGGLCEEAGEEVTDDTADRVRGEDLERVGEGRVVSVSMFRFHHLKQ